MRLVIFFSSLVAIASFFTSGTYLAALWPFIAAVRKLSASKTFPHRNRDPPGSGIASFQAINLHGDATGNSATFFPCRPSLARMTSLFRKRIALVFRPQIFGALLGVLGRVAIFGEKDNGRRTEKTARMFCRPGGVGRPPAIRVEACFHLRVRIARTESREPSASGFSRKLCHGVRPGIVDVTAFFRNTRRTVVIANETDHDAADKTGTRKNRLRAKNRPVRGRSRQLAPGGGPPVLVGPCPAPVRRIQVAA